MASFEILPAIDLRGGRVVRLRQGDFARETVYGDDPAAVAAGFVAAGVRWIHIVDLDGARAGEPMQVGVVREIIQTVGDRARCEVGGGLRSVEAAERAFRDGAARVVLGTGALADPAFAARVVKDHGAERVAVALDVRDGHALGDGWRRGARAIAVADALLALADAGIEVFEVTAVDRDGLLAGPDTALLASVLGGGPSERLGGTQMPRRSSGLGRRRVIASGGIRSMEDLRVVKELGCAGAIAGLAIYEGGIDLAEAVSTLSG